ncbi:pyocin activator PrtN family protein [Acinetobacter ursingii]|uniref:pyocin activator PrtN family protein n=1 Tax=Acinetobacter ursingii TaxID=108980 RepID=UPI00148F2468|nr:pyocin activator PrtN family protein [Acinetobacter ursingii]
MNQYELFLKNLLDQFGSLTPLLENVAKIYYPRLSRAKLMEKARLHKFPFKCYRLGLSQKDPYVVDLASFAKYLSER